MSDPELTPLPVAVASTALLDGMSPDSEKLLEHMIGLGAGTVGDAICAWVKSRDCSRGVALEIEKVAFRKVKRFGMRPDLPRHYHPHTW